MIKYYLKIALRNLLRKKGYSFINIFGLSTSIAVGIFILLYVQFELSFDNYHTDVDNIYRVSSSRKTALNTELFATAPVGAAPTIKEDFPEVIEAGRCAEAGKYHVRYKDKLFVEENTGYADNELFRILAIPLIYGDKETILTRPNAIVITNQISQKYFGKINPVGEVLILDTTAYEVDGVVENFPQNSHLKKDFLLSFHTVMEIMERFGMSNPWAGFNCMNYIKLQEGSDPGEFEQKIKLLAHKYNGEALRNQGVELELNLQPIKDIHLYSNLNWEAEPPGNPIYLWVFSITGIFILLLACMNYMNLITARTSSRSNEIGVKKVIGAKKSQLIIQFIGESFFTTFLSAVFSIIIVLVLLPVFNSLAGLNFEQNNLLKEDTIVGILVIVVIISITSGSYPAFILSNLKPIFIIKGKSESLSSGARLRKILVVTQFSVALTLIIGLYLFYRQVNFMKNQYPGFNREQKLVVEFDRSIIHTNNYESVKRVCSQYPGVNSTTFSSSVPGRWMYFWHLHPFGDEHNDQMINCFQVDYDFISNYDIKMVAGRNFKREMSSDKYDSGWIINEATVKAFGWESYDEALQQHINRESAPVIGIVKNFHLKGLQSEIEPLAMFLMVEDFRYLTLSIQTEKAGEIISFVKEKLNNLFPGYLFDYFFLDEDFNKQYNSEEKTVGLLGIFTLLGICIAVLGLIGLAAFMAEIRTKEIGIRKVLGASTHRIIILFFKEFIVWIALANVFAWPIAYYLMGRWLNNFAYRVDLTVWPFLLSGFIALLLALVTVSYQAINVARANPIDSLRIE